MINTITSIMNNTNTNTTNAGGAVGKRGFSVATISKTPQCGQVILTGFGWKDGMLEMRCGSRCSLRSSLLLPGPILHSASTMITSCVTPNGDILHVLRCGNAVYTTKASRANNVMAWQAELLEVALHKSEAVVGSEVECCFASPACERTAFPTASSQLLRRVRTKFPRGPLVISRSLNQYFLHCIRSLQSTGINFYCQPTRRFDQYRKIYTSSLILSTDKSTMAQSNGSLSRQNFHEDCEANINKQINMELYASYVYMSMAYYFDREDVALPGFHKFFKKASDEEREHAEKFMGYQNIRGGRIVLQPIAKPTRDEWSSPLDAVMAALELEKTVNQTLLDLHGVANERNDPQLCDFLETNFLEEQVKAIKELSEFVAQLRRVGKGLGEHIFDKELMEKA